MADLDSLPLLLGALAPRPAPAAAKTRNRAASGARKKAPPGRRKR